MPPQEENQNQNQNAQPMTYGMLKQRIIDQAKETGKIPESTVATLVAMEMLGVDPGQPMNRNLVTRTAAGLVSLPSMKEMMKDGLTMDLVTEGNTAELYSLFADKESALERGDDLTRMTCRDMSRRLTQQAKSPEGVTKSLLSSYLALTFMMGGDPNKIVNREVLTKESARLAKEPALKALLKDERTAALMKEGKGAELVGLYAEKQAARDLENQKYKRPVEFAKSDNKLFNYAIYSVGTSELSKRPALLERENPLYLKMMKQLEHARSLTEKGIQPTAEETRKLIKSTKKYIDGGTKVPGGVRKAVAFKEAMCVLKCVMPEEEFRSYLGQINAAHKKKLDPDAFTQDRLSGVGKPAGEYLEDLKEEMTKGASLKACAGLMAVQKLSKGNKYKMIRKEDLDKEISRQTAKGSVFARTMAECKNDEVVSRTMDDLAKSGDVKTLKDYLRTVNDEHVRRSAQYQLNRSARALRNTRVSRYTAKENLANMLAAREFAKNGEGADKITNEAFRERRNELLRDPAFNRLADRYSSDPEYRRKMNRAIMEEGIGGTAEFLNQEYQKQKAPVKAAGREQRQPAPAERQNVQEPVQQEMVVQPM